MFKKKHKIEVVPENEYTDFSYRVKEDSYSTKTTIAIGLIPIAAAAGLSIYSLNTHDTYSSTVIPVTSPVIEPTLNVLAQTPTLLPVNMNALATPLPSNTGVIADTSLEVLSTILDPLIQIMVAISFPIASVIMIGACFLFMFDNSEKAWNMIMKAGLGYVLVQMSPLFLEILRQVGKAV